VKPWPGRRRRAGRRELGADAGRRLQAGHRAHVFHPNHSFSIDPNTSRERFLEAHDLIVKSWSERGPLDRVLAGGGEPAWPIGIGGRGEAAPNRPAGLLQIVRPSPVVRTRRRRRSAGIGRELDKNTPGRPVDEPAERRTPGELSREWGDLPATGESRNGRRGFGPGPRFSLVPYMPPLAGGVISGCDTIVVAYPRTGPGRSLPVCVHGRSGEDVDLSPVTAFVSVGGSAADCPCVKIA
jgi:hypothetical protein